MAKIFPIVIIAHSSTVEPVYNGHPRDLRNWPLNTGSLKMLTGRRLMSILMAFHTKHFMQGNNRTINTLSSDQYFKVQCQLVT